MCLPWFFIEWTSVLARARPKRTPLIAFTLDPWEAKARRRLAIVSLSILAVGAGLIAWRLSFDPAIASQDINRVIGWLGLFAMAFCLVRIVAFYLRPGTRDPIAASAFVIVVLAAIADISAVRFLKTYGIFLGAAVTFFPLALLLSLAFRARGIFEAATATADKLNALVTDREREILRNHEEIRRNERAAMLLEERSRIMRDMHDGIGGQLIGLILQARSKKLSDAALVSGLEQSLDDLRMVVDLLEQGEGSPQARSAPSARASSRAARRPASSCCGALRMSVKRRASARIKPCKSTACCWRRAPMHSSTAHRSASRSRFAASTPSRWKSP